VHTLSAQKLCVVYLIITSTSVLQMLMLEITRTVLTGFLVPSELFLPTEHNKP